MTRSMLSSTDIEVNGFPIPVRIGAYEGLVIARIHIPKIICA